MESETSFKVLGTIQTNDTSVRSDYSFMSLTLGDYDNDGIQEIAVDYPLPDHKHFALCTLEYAYDSDTHTGTLVQKSVHVDVLTPESGYHYNQVDLTSGNFDGKGADKLAAAYGRNAPSIEPSVQNCVM